MIHTYMNKFLYYVEKYTEYLNNPYKRLVYLSKVHKHYNRVNSLCYYLLRDCVDDVYLSSMVIHVKKSSWEIYNHCMSVYARKYKNIN